MSQKNNLDIHKSPKLNFEKKNYLLVILHELLPSVYEDMGNNPYYTGSACLCFYF